MAGSEPDVEAVPENVGSVQGNEPDTTNPKPDGLAPEIAADAPQQSPADSGEIEWAGTVVKKPPTPAN
jgi:hypothetical protein